MSLRNQINKLEKSSQLIKISEPISKSYQIAAVLNQLEPEPVIFENVLESKFQVVGNLSCSKQSFANYFGISTSNIIPLLTNAIENRDSCEEVAEAACQEIVNLEPDLDKLPILRHCDGDGGNYISSGIFIANHPKHGHNIDFHRCMQISKTELVVRVVRSRNFDTFLQELKEIDVAISIGNPPNVMAAAATSVEIGINELGIANAMEPLKVVRAKTVDVFVPAESEFILEGTIYLDERHDEGPFVDLTGTYDVIRQEPVMKVKAITHRHDAIWQALLPGKLEHKLLMGMPREPTIYKSVNNVVKCVDVHINPGGSSWLHAIVQIDKQNEDDGKKAIRAAFEGHTSCKHVFVVDEDIDIYNPLEVEWAMATRFQGEVDMIVNPKSPGSSLDPSAEAGTKMTTKTGFDLTKPLANKGSNFEKAQFPEIDIQKYIKN